MRGTASYSFEGLVLNCVFTCGVIKLPEKINLSGTREIFISLVGPTRDNLVLDPLAVLHLYNLLFMSGLIH